MSRYTKDEMKVLIFSGTLTPTEGKVDKDLPKPLKYSLAFCLYSIIGFIIYKVMTFCCLPNPCIIHQNNKKKMIKWDFESISDFHIFLGISIQKEERFVEKRHFRISTKGQWISGQFSSCTVP